MNWFFFILGFVITAISMVLIMASALRDDDKKRGTVTGRLPAGQPNLQQQPKEESTGFDKYLREARRGPRAVSDDDEVRH